MAGRISAYKAATIAGTAYRNNLDAELIGALRKSGWLRSPAMVQCDSINTAGHKRFFVRVMSAPSGRDLTVSYDLTAEEFAAAHEETFSILGELLATLANTELEQTFMRMD